ncbi:oxidoreductase [Nocardioides panzhihuensis]|uniref:NAD(P)-dependent dehydrogenase (Short-subunit alcohol dehydrogenase family) n=1 Tax=Nocardioides panzhihuensis TaxID=860243 RepID=A0A7Z0DJ13_9ACTN|nr:oxidoreductase [Nocardioides panzhihuensis]NYI76388.1 NAD(P)-dependent dehydrogenase (short-subunit alcohol dehydrogenase family) [Nocardioides panzhihuensis]
MNEQKWTSQRLPSFEGRTVIVTGATSGLGRIVATELSAKGAHVVLAVRNVAVGEEVAATIGGKTEVRSLDLADLGSVRQFADAWTGEIDVLINNAGIMMVPKRLTTDGYESQLATNHLGHFALTNLLLPHITDRVVTVASSAHRWGGFDLDDLNWERRDYQPQKAYGQSKISNLLFTLELLRRLEGTGIRAYAAHPGYAATNLQSHTGNRLKHTLMALGNRVVAQSAEAGALPTLYAASQDLPAGSYVGPDGFGEYRGSPTLVGRTAIASDPDLARKLWTESEAMTGVSWPM